MSISHSCCSCLLRGLQGEVRRRLWAGGQALGKAGGVPLTLSREIAPDATGCPCVVLINNKRQLASLFPHSPIPDKNGADPNLAPCPSSHSHASAVCFALLALLARCAKRQGFCLTRRYSLSMVHPVWMNWANVTVACTMGGPECGLPVRQGKWPSLFHISNHRQQLSLLSCWPTVKDMPNSNEEDAGGIGRH